MANKSKSLRTGAQKIRAKAGKGSELRVVELKTNAALKKVSKPKATALCVCMAAAD